MNRFKSTLFTAIFIATALTFSCSGDSSTGPSGGTPSSSSVAAPSSSSVVSGSSKLTVNGLPITGSGENLYQTFVYESNIDISSEADALNACLADEIAVGDVNTTLSGATDNFTMFVVENGERVLNGFQYVKWTGTGTFKVVLSQGCGFADYYKLATINFSNGSGTVDYSSFELLN